MAVSVSVVVMVAVAASAVAVVAVQQTRNELWVVSVHGGDHPDGRAGRQRG